MTDPIFDPDSEPFNTKSRPARWVPWRFEEARPWQWDEFFHADDLRGVLHQPKGDSL